MQFVWGVGRAALAGLGLVALAGCQTAPERAVVTAAFDARAAEAALRPGDNTIKGAAFMRKASGAVVTAAGEVVYLIPETAYARERFSARYGGLKFRPLRSGGDADDADPDYARLMRRTKADRQGDFVFENVRPGRYLVATQVSWTEPRETAARGGAIYENVEVKGSGETVEVIVSGR
jgi:hypothetical protein